MSLYVPFHDHVIVYRVTCLVLFYFFSLSVFFSSSHRCPLSIVERLEPICLEDQGRGFFYFLMWLYIVSFADSNMYGYEFFLWLAVDVFFSGLLLL